MAYEFSLTGTRRGPARAAVNPFTGKSAMLAVPVMSDDERAAVLEILSRHGGAIEDGHGTVVVSGAELTLHDIDGERYEVSITGAIEPAIRVLFEIASAGRLVVMNIHEKCDEPVPVVTTAEAAAQSEASGVEPNAPDLVTDVERFLRVLLPGYGR